MNRSAKSRGAAAVVALVVVLMLAIVAAAYWMFKKGALGGGSAFDLAGHLPQASRAVWMLNLKGQIDPSQVRDDYGELFSKLPADKKKELEASFQSELGISLGEFVKLFDGRAAGALLQSGDKPGAVALVGLRDGAAFDKLVRSKMPAGTQSEKLAGVEFTFTPDGPWYGQDGTWAYFADSKASAELLLSSAAGKETLAGQPAFAEAQGRVAEGGSLMAGYWDIAGTVKGLEGKPVPYTDAQTFKDLACLQYAVGSLDLRGQQGNAFLKVLDDKSSLSQKLLAKGSITPLTFAALSKSSDNGHAVDLEWTFNTLVQLGMLSPDSRQAAGMAGMGLAMYGNPFTAFEGEVAISSNWVQTLTPIIAENFGSARAQGQLTACGSNLKNIATALEMWSTDNKGRYPKSTAELTPNYLKMIPECPAAGTDTYSSTLKVGTDPDSYKIACSGNHHKQATMNLPSYSSSEGLNGGTPFDEGTTPEQVPSLAVTALVKDVKLAHAFVAKLYSAAGAEPKPGEDKTYAVPGATLVMKTAAPARLILGFGDKSAQLLDTQGGSLADQPRLDEALKWGGDGVIYADFMDLTKLVDELEMAIFAAEKSPEVEVAKAVIVRVKEMDLKGASCLAARPDGLAWRASGTSGAGLMFAGGVGAAVMVPNFVRARVTGQTTACKSNLKNIGTACEMWSTDNQGKYPSDLAKVVPDYLRELPDCPAAGSMSYVYYSGLKAPRNTEGYADYYYVECGGGHHEQAGLPGNFPAYNAVEGLIESP